MKIDILVKENIKETPVKYADGDNFGDLIEWVKEYLNDYFLDEVEDESVGDVENNEAIEDYVSFYQE